VDAIKAWGIPISFWLMACCIEVQGQPLDLEERVRTVSTYYVQHYARLYCVPLELVEAIIEVESGWRPEAMSSKGAVGLMQLMPATASSFPGAKPVQHCGKHSRWCQLSGCAL
jgi:hypothetical protein